MHLRSRRPAPSGFTLIELLTVIAIIGILAAIIIPTVGKVRETAQRTVDANNLREIAKAAMIYAGDNNDRLPDPQNLATAFPGSAAVHRFPAALARHGVLTDPSFYFAKNDPFFSGIYPAAILAPGNSQRNQVDPDFSTGRYLAWEFVGGLKMGDPATTPIAYTRGLTANGTWDAGSGTYKDAGGYIAYLGGGVTFYPSAAGKLTSNSSGQAVGDIRQAIPFSSTSPARLYGTTPPAAPSSATRPAPRPCRAPEHGRHPVSPALPARPFRRAFLFPASPLRPRPPMWPAPMTTLVAPAADTTYIIGHKNPDADAICSAISYAAFKEQRGEQGYVAARCGNSNARIDTILQRFHQPLPVYVSDVSPRVRDLMAAEVLSVSAHATCAEALELIDRHDIRLLPVTDAQRHVVGTISLAHLGGIFIPRASEPRLMRQVHSSLANIARALKARVLNVSDENRPERLYVRLGTMDIRSFWKISEREDIPAAQSIIIVGDRDDVQTRAIELGVRAIVVTSNLAVKDDIIKQAQARGVGLIVSPYDSATTAWVVRTASTIERVIETQFTSVHPDARIAEIRRKIATQSVSTFIVLDDNSLLVGVLSRGDILKPVKTKLVLVDHNEMTQAVNGAEEVTITEIIDHHRLGALNTQQPILFINEPVGSTCTIVADLFRREQFTPSPISPAS